MEDRKDQRVGSSTQFVVRQGKELVGRNIGTSVHWYIGTEYVRRYGVRTSVRQAPGVGIDTKRYGSELPIRYCRSRHKDCDQSSLVRWGHRRADGRVASLLNRIEYLSTNYGVAVRSMEHYQSLTYVHQTTSVPWQFRSPCHEFAMSTCHGFH